MIEKIDLKKNFKELYTPKVGKVSDITVPKMNFLMIDGIGDPNNSKEFQQAVEALYTVAYTIKFDFKKNRGIDYPVMALEGLWWADDMSDFINSNRDNWKWTLMIMQPECVTEEIYEYNKAVVAKKKNPAALGKLRFESFEEGNVAQLMHVGPFSEEGPNIEKIHQFIENINGSMNGKHHEIYLSDFRRVNPQNMKTVLRQPYKI